MKLTKIAIALAAVLAMSAVMASAASAVELQATGNTEAELQGVDTVNHVFKVDGQSVTCNESTFTTGKIAVPAKEITANAVYTGCTAFGFAGATVNMGNCHYRITQPNNVGTNEFTSLVDVICNGTNNSANNVINVNSSVFGSECSVSIGENTATPHILIKNTTNDIDLNITINTITATKNKDNGLCPLNGTGTVNNATYTGELTITDINGKAIEIA